MNKDKNKHQQNHIQKTITGLRKR